MTQVTFKFGDIEGDNLWLTNMAIAGRKTATCDRAVRFGTGSGQDALPVVGRRDMALYWDGTPACEIETQSVSFHTFMEVPEAFALAEGENDTLDGWRRDHRVYFERTGGWAPDMLLMCERFRVVRVLEDRR